MAGRHLGPALSLPVPAGLPGFVGCPGPDPGGMLCTTSLGQGQPGLIPVHSQYVPAMQRARGEGAASAQALSPFFPSCPLISLTLELKQQISISANQPR